MAIEVMFDCSRKQFEAIIVILSFLCKCFCLESFDFSGDFCVLCVIYITPSFAILGSRTQLKAVNHQKSNENCGEIGVISQLITSHFNF